mmetsp:Transcript_19042/g.53414  ORF Transcript_19042/g.53414 Transcript_19042/m.53414 type:complete len:212 (-) Transcript_19042:782-1417(-)
MISGWVLIHAGCSLTMTARSFTAWNCRSPGDTSNPEDEGAGVPVDFSAGFWAAGAAAPGCLKHSSMIVDALFSKHFLRGVPSSERMISRSFKKYVGLFIRTRKYLTASSAYLFRYLTRGLRHGDTRDSQLASLAGNCSSKRMVRATNPGRSLADSRNFEAVGGRRWNSSIIAAATFWSSPGRQAFWPTASFSGSSHFFRCSTSFSPSVALK